MGVNLNKRERLVSYIFLILLFLILVTLSPLSVRDAEANIYRGDGNLLQQVVYLALFGLLCVSLSLGRIIHSLKFFPMALAFLMAWAAISFFWSLAPDVTLRRLIFSSVIIFSLWGCIFHLSSQEIYRNLLFSLGVVIVVDVIASLVMPNLAVHQIADVEQGTIGDWKGIHFHKNIAGSVAAVSFICWGWYFANTKKILALGMTFLSLFFLIKTGAITSIFFAPISFMLSLGYMRFYRLFGRGATILSFMALSLILSTTSLWLFATRNGMELLSILSGFTLTGRTDIWHHLLRYIQENWIFGSGYGAFWDIGERSPILFLADDWVRFAASGHNGYLDILATLGVAGLILLLFFVLVTPLLSIHKIVPAAITLFPVWLNLWIFGVGHNILESNFMDRTRISWVFMLIGIFGLIKLALEQRELEQ